MRGKVDNSTLTSSSCFGAEIGRLQLSDVVVKQALSLEVPAISKLYCYISCGIENLTLKRIKISVFAQSAKF